MYSINPIIIVTDEDLVNLYRGKQDQHAFDDLCKRYTVPLFRYSMSFVRNKDDAEEIVQQTFIKVWKHLSRFDETKKFSVWIYTIARRTALDELKKKRPVSFSEMSKSEDDIPFADTLEDGTQSIIANLQNLREVGAFEEIVKKLSEDKAEIVFLKLYEDMTFEEIGEMTGRPMNTVKSVYRRALEIVRKELEEVYHITAPKTL